MVEARRITGPNLLDDRTGAALDLRLSDADDTAVALWQEEARRLLLEIGWPDERTRVRRLSGAVSLMITAPIDALYAATEVAEAAWEAACARQQGNDAPQDAAPRLRELIRDESRPHIRILQEAAEQHGVTFLFDGDGVSVGTGAGRQFYARDSIPEAEDVPWAEVYDIPVILVTGSNGKTTSVRLIAAMADRAGLVTGHASTDGVSIGGRLVEADDYSGPMGARRVLRHPRVELAVLETARGGILRRGLALRRASAALITNIAEDHFGDWGVNSLEELADAKFVVERVIPEGGTLCLNADDPILVERGAKLSRRCHWFSLEARNPLVADAPGASWLDGRMIHVHRNGMDQPLINLRSIPITMDGAARYNVANVLGALTAAESLRRPDGEPCISLASMCAALEGFHGTLDDNPGRGNLVDLGGLRVLIDYAHNPHGLSALMDMARAVPARRRLIVLGQAGDRTDEALRALARAAHRLGPAMVILKEMPNYRRGRDPGEVSRILHSTLTELGMDEGAIKECATEEAAARTALEAAQEGDLLLLLVHESRGAIVELIRDLQQRRWKPGAPLP